MRLERATLALLALAWLPVAAQDDASDGEYGPPRAGTVGLLEWPRVGSPLARHCPPDLVPLPLFAGPLDLRPMAWIEPARVDPASAEGECSAPALRDLQDRLSPLPLREHGYEEISMMVSVASAPAYRIAVDDGWAWLIAGEDAVYRSYESLLPERLTYLAPAFDGQLCAEPQAEDHCLALAPMAAGEERAVRVLSHDKRGGVLWLQVEVLDRWCGMQEPVALAQGWIRGFDPAQRVSVWFHSRGC